MTKETEHVPTAEVLHGDTGFRDRAVFSGNRNFRSQVYVPNRSWPLI